MRKQFTLIAAIMLLSLFVLANTAQAAVTKYGFNDVLIEDAVVEIEASVKETNKGAFSTCSYFSDEYLDYLGYYEEAVAAGDTAEDVLAFCVAHFDDRDAG